jgi:hypothetical protein
MKTTTLYSALVAIILLVSIGCKKNYDHMCECEFLDGKPAPTTYYSDITKEQAETNCANMQESMNTYVTDSSLVVSCALK